MGNTTNTPRSFWLTLLTFTFIVNLAMMRLTYLRLMALKADLMHSTWSGMLVLCFVIMAVCVWLIFRSTGAGIFPDGILERFDTLVWRVMSAIIFLAILFLIPYAKFTFAIGMGTETPIYDPVLLLLFYDWMCWWTILLAMSALKVGLRTTWQGGFATALVLLGLVYEVVIRFNVVTDYPLSSGWSEGSRYYYASLFFSKWIYGQQFPLPTLHPTRYLLQSLPFLFPSLGLFAHRFWQYLLWIGLTSGAAIALTKRIFAQSEQAIKWLVAGWLFLYLLSVGVYFHLEVMVILPLLFVSGKKNPWRSLIAVIVASIWAGISRVNWFPMPAMIAIAVYLLETPLSPADNETSSLSFKQIVSYLSQPVLSGVTGLVSALLAQAAYIPLSGNADNAGAFTSSFTSDLLWYRLWPNDNFALGVIPAILIVSGPLIIIMILAVKNQWKSLHTIRWLGLIGMLLALFAGSIVVSTKIGGGGDLHNMDTYAVLMGIVALYFFSGRVQVESGQTQLQIRPAPVSALALITPLLFLIPMLSPYPIYNQSRNQAAHQQLVDVVNEAGKIGPVLFINDRQLVALGEVKVPLVYDYEVVTLMEMAMSGNQAYLNRFYTDLANHRFSAIVTTKQNLSIKDEGGFAEENNVWNTYISPYILCYYESKLTIGADTSVEVYTPRTQPGICPSGNNGQ